VAVFFRDDHSDIAALSASCNPQRRCKRVADCRRALQMICLGRALFERLSKRVPIILNRAIATLVDRCEPSADRF
jgi:hypothetical protein